MESAVQKRARLQDELDQLKDEYKRTRDEGILERMNRLKTGIARAKDEIVRDGCG